AAKRSSARWPRTTTSAGMSARFARCSTPSSHPPAQNSRFLASLRPSSRVDKATKCVDKRTHLWTEAPQVSAEHTHVSASRTIWLRQSRTVPSGAGAGPQKTTAHEQASRVEQVNGIEASGCRKPHSPHHYC